MIQRGSKISVEMGTTLVLNILGERLGVSERCPGSGVSVLLLEG